MNTSATVHGVLVKVHDCGVLITGAAGSGKSQLGLELLHAGHALIADDLIHLERRDNAIIGHADPMSAEFLALRCGVLVDVPRHFGDHALLNEYKIDCAVTPGPALSPFSDIPTTRYLGHEIPQYFLQSLPGSAVCVEAIAKTWSLLEQGYDAAETLAARQAEKLGHTT